MTCSIHDSSSTTQLAPLTSRNKNFFFVLSNKMCVSGRWKKFLVFYIEKYWSQLKRKRINITNWVEYKVIGPVLIFRKVQTSPHAFLSPNGILFSSFRAHLFIPSSDCISGTGGQRTYGEAQASGWWQTCSLFGYYFFSLKFLYVELLNSYGKLIMTSMKKIGINLQKKKNYGNFIWKF